MRRLFQLVFLIGPAILLISSPKLVAGELDDQIYQQIEEYADSFSAQVRDFENSQDLAAGGEQAAQAALPTHRDRMNEQYYAAKNYFGFNVSNLSNSRSFFAHLPGGIVTGLVFGGAAAVTAFKMAHGFQVIPEDCATVVGLFGTCASWFANALLAKGENGNTSAIQKWIQRSNGKKMAQVFWNRVKYNGIPVPESAKARETWFEEIQKRSVAELRLMESNPLLKKEIHRFYMALHRMALIYKNEPGISDVLLSIADQLPKGNLVFERTRAELWRLETYRKLMQMRIRFEEFAGSMGIQKKEIQEALDMNYYLGEDGIPTLFSYLKPTNGITRAILQKLESDHSSLGIFSAYDVLQKSGGGISIAIEPAFIAVSPDVPKALMRMQILVTVKLNEKVTSQLSGELQLSTRAKDRVEALNWPEEWRSGLILKIEEIIQSSPEIQAIERRSCATVLEGPAQVDEPSAQAQAQKVRP